MIRADRLAKFATFHVIILNSYNIMIAKKETRTRV
jgi:hypothetical protein